MPRTQLRGAGGLLASRRTNAWLPIYAHESLRHTVSNKGVQRVANLAM